MGDKVFIKQGTIIGIDNARENTDFNKVISSIRGNIFIVLDYHTNEIYECSLDMLKNDYTNKRD